MRVTLVDLHMSSGTLQAFELRSDGAVESSCQGEISSKRLLRQDGSPVGILENEKNFNKTIRKTGSFRLSVVLLILLIFRMIVYLTSWHFLHVGLDVTRKFDCLERVVVSKCFGERSFEDTCGHKF
jgi:hypothetical protein